MKANELMIGDWVIRKRDKRPMTVVELTYAETIAAITPDDVYYGDMQDYHESEVEPIPLTPEILEKNGFRIIQTERVGPAFGPCAELRNERFYVKVFFNGNGTISTEIGNQVSLKNENGLADMRSFTCDWVNDMCIHQLQHALRLCGIEKEIVI